MRAISRLLVPLALVLGGTAVAPLATAAEPTDPPTPIVAGAPDPDNPVVDDASGTEVTTPGDPLRTTATASTVTSSNLTSTDELTDAQEDALDVPAMTVTLTGQPSPTSTSGTATFSFVANRPAATFVCTLKRGSTTLRPASPCGVPAPATVTTSDGPVQGTSASIRYTGLVVGSYTFEVTASTPAAPGPEETGELAPYTWAIGSSIYARDRYTVPAGATFNSPLGDTTARRRNLTHVIRTINSMPGYRVDSQAVCDPDVSKAPSRIRITLYSATDMAFARALVAAAQRCVSVQILMNNHLGPVRTASVRYLQTYLGGAVFSGPTVRRVFAHRCNYGCRGGGVLHSKFYLFDSDLPTPGGVHITHTTMVGSSNMTSNASNIQWNDLYTVRPNSTLHSQYLWMFQQMQRDRDQRRTYRFSTGIYQSTFTPQTPGSVDPTMAALRSIRCLGAVGAGYRGHSVVHINIHAWFGTRGYGFAKQVRAMRDRGCYVRVLYSFMSRSVYNKLTVGTGGVRMSVRRTIFSLRGTAKRAEVYSHFKMISASGYVGGNRSASVVWTGSNNFTNDGVKFDEVTLRIASRAAYTQYVNHFNFIVRRKSGPGYWYLLEPIGGGRAI